MDKKFDEKQFMVDLWDVLNGHDLYCTIEKFREKYEDLIVDYDGHIRLMDDHSEWHLKLEKQY